MKVLVAGWFSFPNGHATAGDLLSRDLVAQWLDEASIPYDVANDPMFAGGTDWRGAHPDTYSHVIFVCGPFGRGELEAEFLTHFAGSRLIGLNLSMDIPLESWSPFDLLIERDSSTRVNADIVFASRQRLPAVVGVCLVEEHPGAEVARANVAIFELLGTREMAIVRIDTRLDDNEVGLRGSAEVEALIARVDALVTTRLHGVVLALKNGTPVLAVDAVPGGGKIAKQCAHIGWPNVLTLDRLDLRHLTRGLDFALTPEAKRTALECADRATILVGDIRRRLLEGLANSREVEASFLDRQTEDGMDAFRAAVRPPGASFDQHREIETRETPSWRRRAIRRASAILRRT